MKYKTEYLCKMVCGKPVGEPFWETLLSGYPTCQHACYALFRHIKIFPKMDVRIIIQK